ncbi:MAG TPA: metalloregulator ArsR/SmtB family transcription factor [Verrucomicrobiae bacterium]|nr:metalloregulator ArsR/SmtB family transcription factor [Verrucomicrobiae bacterium]
MTAPINEVKAEFFRVLGHPSRIRILEVLREGERAVSELVPAIGLEASHLSQQLGVMRRAHLVQSRKEGSSVIYSVSDPMLFELLEVAKRILTASLSETRELLAELEASDGPAPAMAGAVGRSRARDPAVSAGR